MTVSSPIHLHTDFIYANNRLMFYCALCHILLPIHSLMDIRLFPFLVCCECSNKEQGWASVSGWIWESLGISPRVAQLDHFEPLSSFLRKLHTDFHRGFSTLHSHEQWIRASLLANPYQHVFSFKFWIFDILTRVRWNLKLRFLIS